MRSTLTFVLASLALGTACGDSSSGTGGAAATGATTNATGAQTSSTGTTSASSTTGSTSAQTGAGGGGACVEPTPAYDNKGCLTYASASSICGGASDKKVCTFAVSCGFSTGDVSQCGINCEQGTASYCNDATKTQCILDATCSKDCAKLAGCGFIL